MTLHTWWLFALTTFFLSSTPGPNMLHIMTRSAQLGPKRAIPAMLGCLTAILVAQGLSAIGLSAVLLASPKLFEILRYLGVAYLVYLGIKQFREPIHADPLHPIPSSAKKYSALIVFRGGFLVGISNPKLILFAAAFLPQFVNTDVATLPQYLILIVTSLVGDSIWYVVYAFAGMHIARYLTTPLPKRIFNWITGSIFLAFGAALLSAKLK